jgi:hypothetical protein
MSRRVQMPDGRIAQFPDDMTDEAITRAILAASGDDEPPVTSASDVGSRFAHGAAEQSEALSFVRNPGPALKGILDAVKVSGGDPVKMMASGVLGQLQEAMGRGKEAFERIDLANPDVSTVRGQAAQTLLAPLPVVGPMVAPTREAIPADPSIPVDVARVAGGVTGAGLDAALAGVAGYGTGLGAAGLARRGAARETRRLNTTVGARPRHYAAGRNPARAAAEEGIAPGTPAPEVVSRAKSSLTRETGAKAQVLADADAAGVVASTGTDVTRSLNDAFVEAMNDSRRALGPDAAEVTRFQRAYDNFIDRGRQTSYSASEMDTLIRDVDKWIKLNGKKTPVGLALQNFRRSLNAQLRQGVSGIEQVNTRIRDRASMRQAGESLVEKEAAAGVTHPLTGAELLKLLAVGAGGAGAGKLMGLFDRD